MKVFKWTSLALAVSLALPVLAQESKTADAAETSSEEVEVISVKGVKLADLKARTIERESNSYSSVIATDDVGNFVDQNVAESLRRLPGVTLERSEGEGTHVSIRGLGPNFVAVSMNGGEMAGVGDDRSVGLAGITGDSLGSIEVFKTLTPEMNLNSIGGLVNVKSISAFDKGKETFKVKIQNSYQQLSKQHSPKFSLDGTEFFLDKKLGVGFSAGFEDRKIHVEDSRQHDTLEMPIRQVDVGYIDGSVETVEPYGDEIITPSQFERRLEDAGRERTTANLNIEFRPNDTDKFYIRANYSKYTDDDIALREKFDFADAGGIREETKQVIDDVTGEETTVIEYKGDGETAYVNGDTKEFIVTDIDVQNQYFIQEGQNVTKTFSIGGEHLLGDSTTVDYEFSHSKAVSEIYDGRRAQFRERDLIVLGQGFKDRIRAEVLTPEQAAQISGLDIAVFDSSNSDTQGDASALTNFDLDNIFLEDSYRTDEIESLKLNLQHYFDFEHLSYVKFGGIKSERVHDRGKDRWSFVPSDGDCNGNSECLAVQSSNLADYTSVVPDTGGFTYPLPVRDDVEYITSVTKGLAESASGGGTTFESTRDDYQINEDTYALYAMAELPINDEATVITGVRYVHTEFSSTGFLSVNNDKFSFGGDNSLDINIPLPDAKITYSEFFPSVHLRYEPSEDILVRAALWTSYTRPSFNQARAFAKLDSRISLCDPNDSAKGCHDDPSDLGNPSAIDLQGYVLGSENVLKVGNPNLVAMSSTNFDTSIGWYPSDDLFFEASFFHKNIDNFIYDAVGAKLNLNELPLTLPVDHITAFSIPQDLVIDTVNITLNGEKATVTGVEISYNQFFENGFFVQSNATFLTSEAQVDDTIRAEKLKMPNQADTTINLSVGWENEGLSVRLIGNYRSDLLDAIATCPAGVDMSDPRQCKAWADRYIDAITTVDFKVKYDVSENISMYFDAINITDEVDLEYVNGNELSGGNVLYKQEFYGATYQLGLTYKFY